MIEDETYQEILGELTSYSASERGDGAEGVVDVVKAFSPEQADEVAGTLVRLALAEKDADARDSQLNALAELTVWHRVDRAVVGRVFTLDAAALGPSEREYLADLREYCDQV